MNIHKTVITNQLLELFTSPQFGALERVHIQAFEALPPELKGLSPSAILLSRGTGMHTIDELRTLGLNAGTILAETYKKYLNSQEFAAAVTTAKHTFYNLPSTPIGQFQRYVRQCWMSGVLSKIHMNSLALTIGAGLSYAIDQFKFNKTKAVA